MYCVYGWCEHQHERCVRLHENPATWNRTRDHLIAATLYSQMLYQLSYSRSDCILTCHAYGAMNWAQALCCPSSQISSDMAPGYSDGPPDTATDHPTQRRVSWQICADTSSGGSTVVAGGGREGYGLHDTISEQSWSVAVPAFCHSLKTWSLEYSPVVALAIGMTHHCCSIS